MDKHSAPVSGAATGGGGPMSEHRIEAEVAAR